MSDPQRPEQDNARDPLAPFEQALRARVPSREALLAEAKAQTARQQRRKRLAGGALSILLLGGAVWLIDPAWRSEDVLTAIGQRHSLTLADGSQVQLNSASHLRVEQRLRSRQFELLEGEATFSVTHGPKPFIVRSQGVAVRDIGTVFNVRSDSRGVAVAVLEGAVEVSASALSSRQLHGGEQVLASDGAISATTFADSERVTAWQHGKLRFDGTPLRDVIADIQRYRQAPIRLADERLGGLRMSGEYDSAAIESLVNLLPSILPVRIARVADGSVVVSGR
ncbi:FecR family protein [Pseudomonas sp. LRF_L74]|uniref:FecR family protein n=1 Tax=Pseudomonas sp. LRF_L74 TaxID=3369422 RepID=UPI003F5F0E84